MRAPRLRTTFATLTTFIVLVAGNLISHWLINSLPGLTT